MKACLSVSGISSLRLEGNEEKGASDPRVAEIAPAASATYIFFPLLPGHTVGFKLTCSQG